MGSECGDEAKMKGESLDFLLIAFGYCDYSEEVLVRPAQDERNLVSELIRRNLHENSSLRRGRL